MSLAEVSEARKARLIALRKRKAGEVVEEFDRFLSNLHLMVDSHSPSVEPIIKSRNFDPESRTLKKRTREDDAMMLDTVEKNVEGLAQKIILEDEHRRAQELVRGRCTSNYVGSPAPRYRMYSTLHRNGRTGI
jgi:coiled-coil domain-containing protein 12